MSIEVEFYENDTGSCPARDFLDELSGKEAQKLAWVLSTIQTMPRICAQYFKKLKSTEIWEVRAIYGGNQLRILGFMDGDTLYLTNGFRKKTDKTPLGEIEVAEHHRKRYFRRKA